MLYLADCYERAGRSASAWALFREVADSAQRAGAARSRAHRAASARSSWNRELSKLELRVPPERQVPGLEVLVDGAACCRARPGTRAPRRPGRRRIEARAPGKKSWRYVADGRGGPAAKSSRCRSWPTRRNTNRRRPHGRAPQAPHGELHAAHRRLRDERRLGWWRSRRAATSATARTRRTRIQGGVPGRRPNACTRTGVDLREDAKTSAALSTIGTVSGGLLVASGIRWSHRAFQRPAARRAGQLPNLVPRSSFAARCLVSSRGFRGRRFALLALSAGCSQLLGIEDARVDARLCRPRRRQRQPSGSAVDRRPAPDQRWRGRPAPRRRQRAAAPAATDGR